MTGPHARQLSEALGQLLLRETRAGLYEALVEDVSGVDTTTYPVLSGLARMGGDRTASELAVAVGLDRSVASRHLDALERAGLVQRRPSPTDRRAVVVSPTDSGRAAIDTMRTRLSEFFATFLDRYPKRDQEQFAAMFVELTEHLRAGRQESDRP